MKTFVRLIRRYVLAAVGIVLLLLFSGVAVLGWLGWQEGCRLPQREYSSSEIADSMVETAEGLAFGAERTPQEWMNGYEWAMVLDDVGNIRWSYGLPQDLNHAYTPGDIARFARWYLADYPVFCWTEPYGLFVIGLPKGSLWKYSIYSSPDFALSMVRVLPAAALGMLLLGLALFLTLGIFLRDLERVKKLRWLMAAGAIGLLGITLQTVWMHWRKGRPFNCLPTVLPGNWQKS